MAKTIQTRWAKYLHVPVVETNSIGMKLVVIPPGEFDMGSEKGIQRREAPKIHNENYGQNLPGEAPRHRVHISSPYWIGATLVTQEEYERVAGSNPSHFKGDPKRPVDSLSWDEAVEFCHKLSELTAGVGQPPLCLADRSPMGARLPRWKPLRLYFSSQPGYLPNGFETKVVSPFIWFHENSAQQPTRSARNLRTLGVCTTCAAISISGVRIGTTWTIMHGLPAATRKGPPVVRDASRAAVHGTTGTHLSTGIALQPWCVPAGTGDRLPRLHGSRRLIRHKVACRDIIFSSAASRFASSRAPA